jgi:uncharacterized damage-inducible protein DinB
MVSQTPWLQRHFVFNFSTGMFPIIYSRLLGAIPRLESLFANVDEKKAGKSVRGWSAKEHLGHLYDLEELWWNRWKDYLDNKETLTAADISNKRTTEANHNGKEVAVLLSAFKQEREKILDAIYDADEDLLSRTSLHPRLKTPMRVVDYLYFVAEHDDHHTAAIMQLLK